MERKNEFRELASELILALSSPKQQVELNNNAKMGKLVFIRTSSLGRISKKSPQADFQRFCPDFRRIKTFGDALAIPTPLIWLMSLVSFAFVQGIIPVSLVGLSWMWKILNLDFCHCVTIYPNYASTPLTHQW